MPLRMTEENSRACKAEQELYLVRERAMPRVSPGIRRAVKKKNQDLCQALGEVMQKCGFLQRKSKNLDYRNVVRPMLRWVYSTESGVSGRGFPFFPRRFLIAGYRIF